MPDKTEQQKLNDLLDFLKDILSERVIDSIRLQVGRAMSECVEEERSKKVSPKLIGLEPILLYYERHSNHNPMGKSALNEVVKKVIELYKLKP